MFFFNLFRKKKVDEELYQPEGKSLLLIKQYVSNGSVRSQQALIEQHPELLESKWDGYLQQLADRQQIRSSVEHIERRRQLLMRCREVGVEAAFAEHTAGLPQEDADEEVIMEALRKLMSLKSMFEKKSFIEQTPLLLEPKVDEYFGSDDPKLKEVLESHRTLLRMCREEGASRTFELKEQFGALDEATKADLVKFLFDASGVPEKLRLIRNNPQMTSELAGQFLDEFLRNAARQKREWASNPQTIEWVRRHQSFLVYCREIGQEAAARQYSSYLN